ncbi:MAG: hypothetical protein IID32_08585 [Planctomycetes bacterium]|nr:hypothetical protein [Planctomycetota bacterium]
MTADPAPNPSDSHTHPDNPPTALDEEIQKINQDLLVAKFEAMKAPPTRPAPTTTPSTSETPNLQTTDEQLQTNVTHRQTDNIIDEIMNDIVQRDIALTQQRLARQK